MPQRVRRIVMLTNALAPDKLGGLERYVRELSAALVRGGLEVTVLTKQTDPSQPIREVSEEGIEIVRHRAPRRTNPGFVALYPWYIAGAVARELWHHPDWIVHGHYPVTTLPVAISGRPFLNTFHAAIHKEVLLEHADQYWLPGLARRSVVAAVRRVEQRVVSSAYRNFTLSEFMRKEVGQLSARAAANTRIIPGGVDSDFFCQGEPGGDEWSRAASALLFTARRLVHRTGVEELVAAMPSVLEHLPGVRLAIAGDGPRRAAIEAAISARGLTGCVRLLGAVSETELRGWYRAADLTVIPTQMLEGFGLTTAESLCCGTPVLATPVGANPEVVKDFDPMFLAEDSTPDSIASALRRVLQRPDVLDAAGRQARKYAAERWSWNVVADSYRVAYEELGEAVGRVGRRAPRERMRIFHLTTTLSPGGAEHHVLSLAREQVRRGHQVSVAYLKGDGGLTSRFLEAGCAPVEKVPLERWRDGFGALRLLRRSVAGTDVIHTHLLKANVLGGLAALLGGLRCAVIATKHSDEPSLKRRPFGAVHGVVSRLCDDQVIAVSDHVGAFVHHHGGVATSRIRTIHNCYDPTLYPPPKPMDLRREFQLPLDSFVFGIVALVKEAKNHRLLLRAFAQLIESFPKARLMIVGDQGQYSSTYFDLVKSDIQRLSLERYVTLTGWRADSFNIIGALDCMVMPSAWEGFGIVFLESLVQGVPVISTRVSGIPEVVRDEVDGFLVDSGDVGGLCAAMERMMAGYELIRSRVQSQGPPYVLGQFSLKAMVDQTLDTYQCALSQKGKR